VHGYVPKESAASEIAAAIRSVYAGREYVSPLLSSLLINRSQRAEALAKEVPGLDALAPVEIKVLKLLAEIKTTKEIADALCMSPRTVERHRTGIAAKLELQGSLALTRFAVKYQSALKNV
jgi:two-component system response regulator NreC